MNERRSSNNSAANSTTGPGKVRSALSNWYPMTLVSGRARKAHGMVAPTTEILRGAAADATRSRLPQMAAALAYRTVFGMIPVIVIGLLILKSTTSKEEMASAVRQMMEYAGLTHISVSSDLPEDFEGPPAPPAPQPEERAPLAPDTPEEAAETEELKQLAQETKEQAQRLAEAVEEKTGESIDEAAADEEPESLDDWITRLVENVSDVSARSVGAVGLLALLYAAISMLVEVERAFNQIYRVPQGRSWTRRLMIYWTLLTLGPVGLYATFYLAVRFTAWATPIAQSLGLATADGGGILSIKLIGFLITVMISTALLMVMYMVVPNTRVRVWPGLAGATAAAILWEAGKWGFTQYVVMSGSTSYGRLYGSIALIPLFLLWVYVTWVVILFGLQISYHIQYARKNKRAQPLADGAPAVVDPTAAVKVLATIGRGFERGETPEASSIARLSYVHEGVARLVLSTLVERGYVHRLENAATPEAEPAYTLARPPGAIKVRDILAIGYELSGQTLNGDDDPVTPAADDLAADPFARRLRRAQLDAVGEQTLLDILPSSPGGTPEPRIATPATPAPAPSDPIAKLAGRPTGRTADSPAAGSTPPPLG